MCWNKSDVCVDIRCTRARRFLTAGRSWVWIPCWARSSLCGVCMLFPCLHFMILCHYITGRNLTNPLYLRKEIRWETEPGSSLTLIFQVHRKIREDSDMAQDSLQCLAQLASMHGPIFPNESAQISYLAHLVEGLLSMINGSVRSYVICSSRSCCCRWNAFCPF